MRFIIIFLVLGFTLNAQEPYLFDATYIESINDSTSLYEIKMANLENSYHNYSYYEVQGRPYSYSTNALTEKIVGVYDEDGFIFYHYNDNNYLERLDRNVFNGTLDRVIDGDTYWINLFVPNENGQFNEVKTKVRLFNCDAYEKTTITLYNRELGRKETPSEHNERLLKANEAKKYAKHLLATIPFVVIYKHKYKNSRIVATIMFNSGKTMKDYLKEANLLTGKFETF